MTRTTRRSGWLILSTLAYLLLAYGVTRSQFTQLMGLLTALFLGYAWVLKAPDSGTDFTHKQPANVSIDRFGFGAAVFFRLLLLVAIPQLSDDIYRFVWDGRLLAHGFNPYLYLPTAVIDTSVAPIAGLDRTLFQHLNSPNYYTVYPPLNQAFFGLAAWLSGKSFFWNVVWLRVPILLAEGGTLYLMPKLLHRLNRNPNLALLYGLNPLVILELTGNLHFEAVMIFFVLLAVWYLLRVNGHWPALVVSAGALALAIGTKLLPLLLLPLVVRRLGWKGRPVPVGVAYVALTGLFTMLLFAPFAGLELVRNLFSSINLYFQKFEFNASVYYVLRTIGYWLRGYNMIESVGFWLSVTTTGSILWISFRWQRVSTAGQVLAILTLYFAFATTVHPWYVTSVVAAAVFTRFRYPIVWSALIPLSYFTYQTMPYHENLWLTAVEYGLVGIVLLAEIVPVLYPKSVPKSSKSSTF